MANNDNPIAVVINTAITQTSGLFPRVPGDQPASYPDQSPPGNAWMIYYYRERRCYWHFGRPAA